MTQRRAHSCAQLKLTRSRVDVDGFTTLSEAPNANFVCCSVAVAGTVAFGKLSADMQHRDASLHDVSDASGGHTWPFPK